MWSAPGWWKLRPMRPVKDKTKKAKRFYKRGKTWKGLIKASLLTDTHLIFHPTVSREQTPALTKCLTWHEQTHLPNVTQWQKTWPQITNVKSEVERHTFLCCHISHTRTHSHKQKAAITLGIQQSVMHALLWWHCVHETRAHLSVLSWGEGWCPTSKWKPSWLSVSIIYSKTNTLKLRQKYPTCFRTDYCCLTVNSGSLRGTPFIPSHLKWVLCQNPPTPAFYSTAANLRARWSNIFTWIHFTRRCP